MITIINATVAITLLEQRPEKISGTHHDSNPQPLQCQCSALPTELTKPHESTHIWVTLYIEKFRLGPNTVKYSYFLQQSRLLTWQWWNLYFNTYVMFYQLANYGLTNSTSESSGFTCTSPLTMNKKFQYHTRPLTALLKISSSLLVNKCR